MPSADYKCQECGAVIEDVPVAQEQIIAGWTNGPGMIKFIDGGEMFQCRCPKEKAVGDIVWKRIWSPTSIGRVPGGASKGR